MSNSSSNHSHLTNHLRTPNPSTHTLLVAAKARHRLVHPHARYSESGQLRCVPCQVGIKAEALWSSHLASKSHRQAVARATDRAEPGRESAAGRKGEDELVQNESEQKKTGPAQALTPPVEENTSPTPDDPTEPTDTNARKALSSKAAPEGIDPAEWARFEQEVLLSDDKPIPKPTTLSRGTASVIEAPALLNRDSDSGPMTNTANPKASAEALAEKAAKDATLEAEKTAEAEAARLRREKEDREDFLRRLDDEAFEQETADARVAALKAKREALRLKMAAKKRKI